MSKKTVPKFIEKDPEENNNQYELEVKKIIFNKLNKFNFNEFIKFNMTQNIYNKYFYDLKLMEEDKKIFNSVLG